MPNKNKKRNKNDLNFDDDDDDDHDDMMGWIYLTISCSLLVALAK